MPDITACVNQTCPIRSKCYRFRCVWSPRQSVSCFTPNKKGSYWSPAVQEDFQNSCAYFSPILPKDKVESLETCDFRAGNGEADEPTLEEPTLEEPRAQAIEEIPDPYREALELAGSSFARAQEALAKSGRLNLEDPSFPITRGILRRLQAYYNLQDRVKSTIHKRVSNDGADFFTETVTSFVAAAIAGRSGNPQLRVLSEEKLCKKRGTLRPDVSIWEGNQPLAVIECKTQMGWSRKTWEKEFVAREDSLQKDFPGLRVYHVILTQVNWPGLPEDHPNTGKKWFCLSRAWPSGERYSVSKEILNPIEPLLRDFLK